MTKLMTLCLVREPSRVLLGMKKRGFGAGRWNGFGGKVESNENITAAAARELQEESGLTAEQMELVGVINFEFAAKPGEVLAVHIFKVTKTNGDLVETEEMKPQWFSLDQIPFDVMWPDDRHWVPLFLADKKFTGRFLFGAKDVILEQELITVEELAAAV